MGIAWDNFILTFPLWCPGQAAMTASEGVINVHYSPPKRRVKTEEQLLAEVTQFAARAMDRLLRHQGIYKVNVWAIGMILDKYSRKRVPRKMILTLDKRKPGYPSRIISFSRLAKDDPKKYLNTCAFRWLKGAQFLDWPKHNLPFPAGPPP
jgi:hypothetical protein